MGIPTSPSRSTIQKLLLSSPNMKNSEIINSLLALNERKTEDIESACLMLIEHTLNFERAAAQGWGYEEHHMAAINQLEMLAQKGEKWIKNYRHMLDTMRRALYLDSEASPVYMPAASFGEPISISYDQNRRVLHVVFSEMLPFSLNGGANYFHDKLAFAIVQFDKEWKAEHNSTIALSPAAVVFVHHYDNRRICLNYVRDYDNLERKCILNALQMSRLFSDNPTRMIDMNMAVADERTFTEVLVTRVDSIKALIENLDFSLYI